MNIYHSIATREIGILVGLGLFFVINPIARRKWLMWVFVLSGAAVTTTINEKAFPDSGGAVDVLRGGVFGALGGVTGGMLHQMVKACLGRIGHKRLQNKAGHTER